MSKNNKNVQTETETPPVILLKDTEDMPDIDEMVAEEVNIEEAIEAILFAAGHPMTYEQLARPFEIAPSLMRERVSAYAERYNSSDIPRGVMLLTLDNCCQLCTKEQYLHYIRVALGIRKSGSLSTSSIEALAIIAYNQPTTRAYVDSVRGVDSSYAVSTLLERGLIKSTGRLDAPGRPMLYGTTDDFLRCFGLGSLSELPGIGTEEAYEALARINANVFGETKVAQLSMDDDLTASENTDCNITDTSVTTEESDNQSILDT